MSDKGHQEFIEHACESFKEDDELALASKNYMTRVLEGSSANLTKAVSNLDRNHFLVRKKFILLVSFIVAISFILAASYFFIPKDYQLFRYNNWIHDQYEEPLNSKYQHLSDEERLILFGDHEDKTKLDIAETRLALDPQNPVYYYEYIYAYRREHGKFPEDMVKVWDEIDSSNGLSRLIKAGKMTDTAIGLKRKKRTKKSKQLSLQEAKDRARARREAKAKGTTAAASSRATKKRQVEVLDEALYNEALGLVFQAAKKSVITEYDVAWRQERVPLLDKVKRNSLKSHITPLLYQKGISALYLRKTAELLSVEARRCGERKDVEGLKQVILVYSKLADLLLAEAECAGDYWAIVARSYIQAPLNSFREATTQCELPHLNHQFALLNDRIQKDIDQKGSYSTATIEKYNKYGSIVAVSF